MRCEQARHLFDAYLDGELSQSQRAEFGAHRLQCADCRRELALLEVTGHILSTPRDPVVASEGFTDRLLACIDAPQSRWTYKLRRGLYIGGPIAAAAVVALAFIGVFDRRESRVLGHKVVRVADPAVATSDPQDAKPLSLNDAPDPRSPGLLKHLQANVTALEQMNANTLTLLRSLQESSVEVDDAAVSDDDFVGPPAPDDLDSEIEDF